MFKKFIKRLVCAAAIVSAVGVSVSMSGCTIETNHPNAKITIEFNGETYEINYKLYRNMYPQTVRHFIELADAGFYDNTIIHNYTSNDWYGGGYSYIDGDGDESYSNSFKYASYYDVPSSGSTNGSSKEKAYYELFQSGALTASVFKPGTIASAEYCTSQTALSTLIGEFTSNDHTIDNGALESQYGGLRMYYTSKSTSEIVTVLTGKGQYLEHNYKYNCATSLFAIQVGSSSSLSDDDYCLFGVLKNSDATEVLEDLQDDIEDYIDSLKTDFTYTVSNINIDNYEEVSDDDKGADTSYTVTSMPIIIRSVKITKY